MGLIDFSIGDIGNLFKDIREAITGKGIEDPNKKAEIQYKLTQLEQALLQGQIEINKEEAKHPNWFVAGWRPFIGWVSGAALTYQFIVYPILGWASLNFGWQAPPSIDAETLKNIVFVMLGVGTLRTVEKFKGVQDKH